MVNFENIAETRGIKNQHLEFENAKLRRELAEKDLEILTLKEELRKKND